MNYPNICRECWETTDYTQNPLIIACNCGRNRRFIHLNCLLTHIIERKGERNCDICGQSWYGIDMQRKEKSFK